MRARPTTRRRGCPPRRGRKIRSPLTLGGSHSYCGRTITLRTVAVGSPARSTMKSTRSGPSASGRTSYRKRPPSTETIGARVLRVGSIAMPPVRTGVMRAPATRSPLGWSKISPMVVMYGSRVHRPSTLPSPRVRLAASCSPRTVYPTPPGGVTMTSTLTAPLVARGDRHLPPAGAVGHRRPRPARELDAAGAHDLDAHPAAGHRARAGTRQRPVGGRAARGRRSAH
jgi:hypothetical protein